MKRILLFSISACCTFSTFTMHRPCLRPAPQVNRAIYVLPRISRRFTNVSPNPCHLERCLKLTEQELFGLARKELEEALKRYPYSKVKDAIKDKESTLERKLRFMKHCIFYIEVEKAFKNTKPGELPVLPKEYLEKNKSKS